MPPTTPNRITGRKWSEYTVKYLVIREIQDFCKYIFFNLRCKSQLWNIYPQLLYSHLVRDDFIDSHREMNSSEQMFRDMKAPKLCISMICNYLIHIFWLHICLFCNCTVHCLLLIWLLLLLLVVVIIIIIILWNIWNFSGHVNNANLPYVFTVRYLIKYTVLRVFMLHCHFKRTATHEAPPISYMEGLWWRRKIGPPPFAVF